MVPIPIIGGIIDKILGIGEKVIDRVVPDTNKREDQKNDRSQKQADATIEGERNTKWTPRKILMMVLSVPVALNFAVKPTVEWLSIVFGHPITLPGIDVAPALKILLGLLGLELGS